MTSMSQPNTGRILAVLFECRGARAFVPEIVTRAAGTRPVTVLQILDPAHSDRLCRKLRTDGWMGATRSQQLGKEVRDDFERRFDQTIDKVCQALRDTGLDVEKSTESGDLINLTLRVAENTQGVDLILLGRPRRGLLAKWMDGLNTRVLMDRAPCPVELIELPNE
ncbi:MAG: nucleotide-binding universal stress UspA family protein [Myxococcota bacterium]|jgi:nucleotide-binding universal stress UspA family protein